MSKKMTMLEKILERRVKPAGNGSMTPAMLEIGEVLVAWAEGKIETDEARAAIGHKSNGQVAQSAGTAFRNLLRGGYITVTWTGPADAIIEEALEAK